MPSSLRLLSLLGAVFCVVALPTSAQIPSPLEGSFDPARLEPFVDGLMTAHSRTHRVAGACVAVVKDDRVILAKGYGWADVKSRTPVSEGGTLFRIGSVTKLFTWTAVMQLVEEGKLDLDRDVNDYMQDVRVPATFPQPVTVRHLLTHTPGFEDVVMGLFGRDAASVIPLREVLLRDMPLRVRPPGRLASYSNHGVAMAGYVVTKLSGVPWEEYVERKILAPLRMEHTSVRQPLPPALAAEMSKGYSWSGGRFDEHGFEFVPAAPAGAASAGALDMARFMLAHLNGGEFDGGRILQPETVSRMHSRLFSHDPRLNHMLHGFYETERNGLRLIGHGGDTLWFHSELTLVPERRFGFFVSYNSADGTRARAQFEEALLDRLFPRPAASPLLPREEFRAGAWRYAGQYASIRRSHRTAAKLAILVGAQKIEANGEGYLLTPDQDGGTRRWVEIEPGLFRDVDNQRSMLFRTDASGRVTLAFSGNAPMVALERLTWVDAPSFNWTLAAVSLAAGLSVVVGWPLGALRRRLRGDRALPAPAVGPARSVAWLAWVLLIAFAAGLGLVLRDPMQMVFGVPRSLKILLVLPVAAAVLTPVVFILTARVWFGRAWGWAGRIHYTVSALALTAMLWFLHHWNLLGFKY